MAFFTTFGSFSIAAGILLIFLIFVMLAAERRGELGIARAIGTRRGHLVQMFIFEGVAYDLVAALVGAAARRGGRVRDGVRHGAARSTRRRQIDIEYAVSRGASSSPTRSACCSRSWSSRLGLAREPDDDRPPRSATCPSRHAARRRGAGRSPRSGSRSAALLALSGVSRRAATPLMLGVSLDDRQPRAASLRALGVSERIAYTACGLAIVVL